MDEQSIALYNRLASRVDVLEREHREMGDKLVNAQDAVDRLSDILAGMAETGEDDEANANAARLEWERLILAGMEETGKDDEAVPAWPTLTRSVRKATRYERRLCAKAIEGVIAENERLRNAGNEVIDAFETLGRTKDAAGLLIARARCERAMLCLQHNLQPDDEDGGE